MSFFKKKILQKRLKIKRNEIGILDKRTKFWKPFLMLIPSALIILLFTLFPFIYTLIKAFNPLTNVNDASSAEFGFGAFEKIFFKERIFQIGIRNSLIYSILSLPLTLFVSILISGIISNLYRKWAKGFWQTIFFLPYITSAIAVSLAFAYIFDSTTGMFNNMFGLETKWLDSGQNDTFRAIGVLLVYGVWKNLAFQVLIITTAMLGVDKNLYKAASIDGASKTKQFFKITLPSVMKTINFLITVGIIGGIKVFPLALFNNDASTAESNGGSTIMLFIYKNVQSGKFALAGAATLVLFVLGSAFSVFLKKSIALIMYAIERLGERNVSNKIKTTKLPS